MKKLFAVVLVLAVGLAGCGCLLPCSLPPSRQKHSRKIRKRTAEPAARCPSGTQVKFESESSQCLKERSGVCHPSAMSSRESGSCARWPGCRRRQGLMSNSQRRSSWPFKRPANRRAITGEIDVAAALAEAGHVRQALEIASAVHREIERDRAYSVVAAGQAKAGDIAGAQRTAALIKADYLKGECTSFRSQLLLRTARTFRAP